MLGVQSVEFCYLICRQKLISKTEISQLARNQPQRPRQEKKESMFLAQPKPVIRQTKLLHISYQKNLKLALICYSSSLS